MRKKSSRALNILMLVVTFAMLYPFWHAVAVSFSDARDVYKNGLPYFWPRVFTLENYEIVFTNEGIINALRISVTRTALTTVLNVLFSSLFAYVLSRKEFVLNKFLTVYMVVPLYVSAGLAPQYMLYEQLHLLNSFWVYIIPALYGAFNVVVIRTYMRKLPESLTESAKMDGANELIVFFRVVLPLCKPVLAAVALFVAAGAWNEWFDTFLYAPNNYWGRIDTLQYFMMQSVKYHISPPLLYVNYSSFGYPISRAPLLSAMAVTAAVPLLIAYPFFQKHFIHGIHYGGVKR